MSIIFELEKEKQNILKYINSLKYPILSNEMCNCNKINYFCKLCSELFNRKKYETEIYFQLLENYNYVNRCLELNEDIYLEERMKNYNKIKSIKENLDYCLFRLVQMEINKDL